MVRNFLKIKITGFTVLVAFTIFCHTFIEQYEKSGPDMLTDDWRLNVPENNRAVADEIGLYLFSSNHQKNVGIYQDIPDFSPGSIYRLSADMKCEDIKAGQKPWNRARFLLLQHDKQKIMWNLPHQVDSLIGTEMWGGYDNTFTIEPETKKVVVMAHLNRSTGSFWLKNITLYPVIQARAYTWAQRSILLSWFGLAIFLLGPCVFNGPEKFILKALLVLAFSAIIIGTTMPNAVKNRITNQIEAQIEGKTQDTTRIPYNASRQTIRWDIMKAGHFVFFLLFSFLLSRLIRDVPAMIIVMHVLVLAGGTEIVQLYISNRSPLFLDFVIDATGGILGIILMNLIPVRKAERGY